MTDQKIARLTIEGTQGAGKTVLLKALCRMMNDSGAVILGAKDWDSQSAILLDMDGFAFPKFAEYGKNYTTSQGLDPIAETLDRAIERGSYVEATIPIGADGRPIGEPVVTKVEAPAQTEEADFRVVECGGTPYRVAESIRWDKGFLEFVAAPKGEPVLLPHIEGDPRPIYSRPNRVGELSPPDVQERAWNAWLSAHASGLSPLGHIRAIHQIVEAIYPSTKDTIPSADDLIQGVRDMLLQEIARQGHDRLVEDAIVERCLSVFIEHGYEIAVVDDFEGNFAQEFTADLGPIRAALRSTSGDLLYLRHKDVTAASRRPWVSFVWGNGVDVIYDYSTTQAEGPVAGMATMMAEIEAFVETLDDRRPAAK